MVLGRAAQRKILKLKATQWQHSDQQCILYIRTSHEIQFPKEVARPKNLPYLAINSLEWLSVFCRILLKMLRSNNNSIPFILVMVKHLTLIRAEYTLIRAGVTRYAWVVTACFLLQYKTEPRAKNNWIMNIIITWQDSPVPLSALQDCMHNLKIQSQDAI